LFARARARGNTDWGTRLLFAAALLAAVLAVLSKPSAVGVPVILLALDRYLVGRPWRTVLASTAAFFAVSLPLVLVTQTAQPVEPGLLTAAWTRPFIAGDSLAFYLAKLALPVGLAIDYGRKPGLVAGAWWGYLTWLLPAALAVAIWLLRRRAAWLLGAALVSLAAVAPVLGLLPFAFQHYSDVADRYLYVALLGPALVLAELLARAGRRTTLAQAGVAAWLMVLGFGTIVQLGYWESTVPLMNRAIEVNPQSDVAYNNRGIVFAQDRKLDAAKRDFESSLRVNPKRYDTLSNLGNVLLLEKDTTGAIADYRASISLKADWDESHANLGAALAKESRWQEAAAEFRIALKLNPGSSGARDGLGQVLAKLPPGTPAAP
jgi:protein O-mannosyl-transferase